MCNLYRQRSGPQAIMDMAKAMRSEVGTVHSKAMPGMLTEADEIEAWMSAPWEIAKQLQRPLADGNLTDPAEQI